MENSRERLVRELGNAGMLDCEINKKMKEIDQVGYFFCILNHSKVLELKQTLKDERDYFVQSYGAVFGGWINVYISKKTRAKGGEENVSKISA